MVLQRRLGKVGRPSDLLIPFCVDSVLRQLHRSAFLLLTPIATGSIATVWILVGGK